MIRVKGLTIGQGQPVICVPLLKTTREELVQEAKMYMADGIRMLEWRADSYPEFPDKEAVLSVLTALQEVCTDTVLIFTVRTKEQGGNTAIDQKAYAALLLDVAKSKLADLMDVEFFTPEDADDLLLRLHEAGAVTIVSHHDFHETPKTDVMMTLLTSMREAGADIVKLAMMPRESTDVLRVLRVTNDFHKEYPDTPIISMSMGELGCVSRFTGEEFGSCVTFGAGENASAPGQLPYRVLSYALSFMHTHLPEES